MGELEEERSLIASTWVASIMISWYKSLVFRKLSRLYALPTNLLPLYWPRQKLGESSAKRIVGVSCDSTRAERKECGWKNKRKKKRKMLLKSDYEGWLVFKAKRLNSVNKMVWYIYIYILSLVVLWHVTDCGHSDVRYRSCKIWAMCFKFHVLLPPETWMLSTRGRNDFKAE